MRDITAGYDVLLNRNQKHHRSHSVALHHDDNITLYYRVKCFSSFRFRPCIIQRFWRFRRRVLHTRPCCMCIAARATKKTSIY